MGQCIAGSSSYVYVGDPNEISDESSMWEDCFGSGDGHHGGEIQVTVTMNGVEFGVFTLFEGI